MRWFLTLLGLSLSSATANPLQPHNMLGLLVPAYFYPGPQDPHWPALALASKRVPLTVIVNPASGPGNSVDPAYTLAVNQVRAAGAKVIGYVHISYGKRPIEQVRTDIERYRTFYELDGVFIDELASGDSPDIVAYQAGLIAQIRSESPSWSIVVNPGVTPHRAHLEKDPADLIVNFENTAAQWPAESIQATPVNTPFAHLVHTTDNEYSMRRIVSGAANAGIQAVYVTDDTMDNPWDTLPRWWMNMVEHIEAINNGA